MDGELKVLRRKSKKGGFVEGFLGTLKTIGLAITFPISLIADLLSFVYSVSVFVFSLLGFVPA